VALNSRLNAECLSGFGIILGTALSAESVDIDCDDSFNCEDDTSYLPMAAGYLLYVGSWVYGVMDASNSADRMNTRRGIAVGGMQVQPAIGAGAGGGTSVGLEVRF
jgi:hypothetical protein